MSQKGIGATGHHFGRVPPLGEEGQLVLVPEEVLEV
jgi:prolyl-tRNA editing enzyme YbaK/EbsC (Cys-tRNA(Pro) deacylase)